MCSARSPIGSQQSFTLGMRYVSNKLVPPPKQATRAQLLRWLGNNQIDPNDPRNAPLMELLKAQEAQSGNSMVRGGTPWREGPCPRSFICFTLPQSEYGKS